MPELNSKSASYVLLKPSVTLSRVKAGRHVLAPYSAACRRGITKHSQLHFSQWSGSSNGRYSYLLQVILVGDMNIAASPKDVHPSIDWARLYHPEELDALRSFLRDYTDVWRLQNPDAADVFTVWDEKSSARAFNKVCTGTQTHFCPGEVVACHEDLEVLSSPTKRWRVMVGGCCCRD